MNIEIPLSTKLSLTSGTYSQTPHLSEINIVSIPAGNSELCLALQGACSACPPSRARALRVSCMTWTVRSVLHKCFRTSLFTRMYICFTCLSVILSPANHSFYFMYFFRDLYCL